MSDIQKEESQKTIVAFVVGLLIGGLLVWAFSGNQTQAPVEIPLEEVEENIDETGSAESEEEIAATAENANNTVPSMEVGEGEVVVSNQPASSRITLDSVTFPIAEGWIGVRDFTNETLGPILGVVRFSQSQGLVPEVIQLQYPTRAGRDYAVVFFTEDGDRQFNLATDVQIDRIFATFTAQ